MCYFENDNVRFTISKTSVKTGEDVNVKLKISNELGYVDKVEVVVNLNGGRIENKIPMKYVETLDNFSYFEANINIEEVGIYFLECKIVINNQNRWIEAKLGSSKLNLVDYETKCGSITVFHSSFEVPQWAKGKIMYHIMVDRFYRSHKYNPKLIKNRITKKWSDMPEWRENEAEILNNDFFMGNLKGIEEKIQYLKGLGVEIIYLSPICKSQSNHRYDTADYEVVDPYLGNNKSLKSLCAEAHKNGMKIIIDAAFNHTGNDSKYFNEYGNYPTVGAFQSKDSPYYEWYRKNEKGEFDYWWGFKNLPVCDGTNAKWQNFIYGEKGIIDKWFELGIDGLRLDVADELTDEFIENIRKAVKRNKEDGFIIGEVWENAILKGKYGQKRQYLLGKGMDSVMNYPFTNAILKFVRFGNYQYLVNTLTEIMNMYPKDSINSLMNSLSTHDITRALTTLAGDGIEDTNNNLVWDVPFGRQWQFEHDSLEKKQFVLAKRRMKIATTIQYFLPGNSCVFYGDEVGLYGYKDPFNRKAFPWDNMDMDLLFFFASIGKLKKNLKFLADAEFRIIQVNNNIFAFERFDTDNEILVIVNRSEVEVKLDITQKYQEKDVIFNYNANKDVIGKYGILIISSK